MYRPYSIDTNSQILQIINFLRRKPSFVFMHFVSGYGIIATEKVKMNLERDPSFDFLTKVISDIRSFYIKRSLFKKVTYENLDDFPSVLLTKDRTWKYY